MELIIFIVLIIISVVTFIIMWITDFIIEIKMCKISGIHRTLSEMNKVILSEGTSLGKVNKAGWVPLYPGVSAIVDFVFILLGFVLLLRWIVGKISYISIKLKLYYLLKPFIWIKRLISRIINRIGSYGVC